MIYSLLWLKYCQQFIQMGTQESYILFTIFGSLIMFMKVHNYVLCAGNCVTGYTDTKMFKNVIKTFTKTSIMKYYSRRLTLLKLAIFV